MNPRSKAHSSLNSANAADPQRATAEQLLWIKDLSRRMPFGKVLVATAHKHARQLWSMLCRGADYDPGAWLRDPIVQRPARTTGLRVEAA